MEISIGFAVILFVYSLLHLIKLRKSERSKFSKLSEFEKDKYGQNIKWYKMILIAISPSNLKNVSDLYKFIDNGYRNPEK